MRPHWPKITIYGDRVIGRCACRFWVEPKKGTRSARAARVSRQLKRHRERVSL